MCSDNKTMPDMGHRIDTRSYCDYDRHWYAVDASSWPDQWAMMDKTIRSWLGQPSCSLSGYPRACRVEREWHESDYLRRLVKYEVGPGDVVRAHMLIPPVQRRRNGAAVICLHGTSAEGKETQVVGGPRPGRDFGRYFAREGFITFAPDHACAGERVAPEEHPLDTAPFYKSHPDWSMVGKAMWDGSCAIDVLSRFDEVDPECIGAVGHSLGGHGSMFLAATDTRIRAAICSGGLTSWIENPKRLNWAREQWYVYFPQLRDVFLNNDPLPFDLPDFAALMAPRAFLNISGMNDPMYGNNHWLPVIGHQLNELYRTLGEPERFANFLFGGEHDVPEYSRSLMLGWLQRWLVD